MNNEETENKHQQWKPEKIVVRTDWMSEMNLSLVFAFIITSLSTLIIFIFTYLNVYIAFLGSFLIFLLPTLILCAYSFLFGLTKSIHLSEENYEERRIFSKKEFKINDIKHCSFIEKKRFGVTNNIIKFNFINEEKLPNKNLFLHFFYNVNSDYFITLPTADSCLLITEYVKNVKIKDNI
jgi:hypothetical protein